MYTAVRLVVLVALTISAIATKATNAIAEPRGQTSAARTQSAALVLEAQGDSESLAAASLLNVVAANTHRLDLMNRAVALDPTRPEFIWLQIHACGDVPQCNPEPMEVQLRKLDPNNGIAWFGAVTRAYRSGDASELDAALASLARTDHTDIYWNKVIAALGSKAASTKTLSPSSSVTSIIGSLAALAIPAYSSLSNACKDAELARSGRTEVCRGIARSLQNSDTYITQMVGVAIAKRVWDENSPQWQAAQKARSLYEYRSKFWPQVEFHKGSEDSDARRYLELCRTYRSEQEVLLAQLQQAGISTTPP